MKDKSKLSIVVPIISAGISLLVLLYGNNIYDRFSKSPNVRIESSKADQFIPDGLLNVTNAYFTNNNAIVNSFRIIKIKNVGSPSRNLRIQLNLDGDIYDHKIESTESITDSKVIANSIINISMDRLSQNAAVDLKVWFREDNKNLQASYSDDISSKKIPINEDVSTTTRTILMTIVAIILIQSVLFLLMNYFRKMNLERKTREKTEFLDWVIAEIGENLSEDNIPTDESNDEVLSTSDKDKAKERLRELIKKNA
ncbi:hypothetical protein [Paenibacillus sp. FSL R5-0470]|uniref:hypothetical protein n=1 Tax=Paenibacillus sp. FSL R5-0470 TaxID=2921641 RepID=UPI0030D822A0